ncbi:hypothetical protein [Micromonospora sp. NPDC050200]|uniref:hypothetical protein n=1 Tax=Micromonospora sp. NPDC050200 TaxID=3155664 RepID=UPI00340352CE
MNHDLAVAEGDMPADEESMTEETVGTHVVRSALVEACPGMRVADIRRLDAGYTSRQWVADTDEGPLLVKTPIRDTDPEHLRRLVATTRRAAESGVPVVRFPWVSGLGETSGSEQVALPGRGWILLR